MIKQLLGVGIFILALIVTRGFAQEIDVPEKPTAKVTGSASIVFGDVPSTVSRTITVSGGCRDIDIFARDCCIRDDVVEIFIGACRLGVVDARSSAGSGTHTGETHTVSLAPGTYTIRYRNIISSVGNSGWEVSESEASTYSGRNPCGGGALKSINPFPNGATCGDVTADQLLNEIMDDAGNVVRLFCKDQDPFVDEFRLEFTPAGESVAHTIGRCPYGEGCNQSDVFHIGDLNRNGKPDCFVHSRYTSTDQQYGDPDDDGDGKVDSVYYEFDAPSNKVNYSEYERNSPAELVFFGEAEAGPDDVFFGHILPGTGVMGSAEFMFCDVDQDGDCDSEDISVFNAALDSCRGEPAFEPLVDHDGDGCITMEDGLLVLGNIFADGFESGNSLRWSNTVGE